MVEFRRGTLDDTRIEKEGRRGMAHKGRIYRRGLIYYLAYRWDGREHRESARSADRDQRPGLATGPGPGELSDRVGVAAQATPAHVRPGRDRLAGQVEVDETLVGGFGGARGRSTATKALVVVAAEEVGRGIGRIRMAHIPDGSAETLEAFVAEAIEPGSGVHTDGWHGYTHLGANAGITTG